MNSTMPHLATKADLKEEAGKLDKKIDAVRTEVETVRTEIETVRTEIEKSQKENRAWLQGATVAIIGVMIAIATFFGTRDPLVAYVPPRVEQQSVSSVENIGELMDVLNELKNRVMEIERENTIKNERDSATKQPSN